MRAVVLGAGGQLGREMVAALREAGHEALGLAHAQADVGDLPGLLGLLRQLRPEVVINCAAYTAVDECERQRELAFRVNALGARNAAVASRKVGARLVHFSTDYVFDGAKGEPYVEPDTPRPLGVYGWSKLWGEAMVREQAPECYLLRLGWLYGPRGVNFVGKILARAREGRPLRVVDDQRGTPTCTRDVAAQVLRLLETEAFGLYHATAEGEATWHEFAQAVLHHAGLPVRVEPIASHELAAPAQRPPYSVLENLHLKLQGLNVMRPWEEALADFWRRHGEEFW
jgi:dTDP-4-dehydrorhamnose reductase